MTGIAHGLHYGNLAELVRVVVQPVDIELLGWDHPGLRISLVASRTPTSPRPDLNDVRSGPDLHEYLALTCSQVSDVCYLDVPCVLVVLGNEVDTAEEVVSGASRAAVSIDILAEGAFDHIAPAL